MYPLGTGEEGCLGCRFLWVGDCRLFLVLNFKKMRYERDKQIV